MQPSRLSDARIQELAKKLYPHSSALELVTEIYRLRARLKHFPEPSVPVSELRRWIKDTLANYRVNGGPAAHIKATCADDVQAILDGAQWDGTFVIRKSKASTQKQP